ncbi:MAG: aldose 1-epimerase [Actinobacteria bacterium]|nr:aldose 1-epimerase [Actinomycetota bacterium]
MHEVCLVDQMSPVVATFVPSAGMVGVSLQDDGAELFGQVQGLQRYVSDGVFMGLPLMHPWANRLHAWTYAAQGRTVTLGRDDSRVHADPNGLPIHGLATAYPGWTVNSQWKGGLTAELDYGADPELLRGFPFPHRLTLAVSLLNRTLRIRAAVIAGSEPVPLCFGFHPYLRIPDVPRDQWVIETPAMRHLELDDSYLPTGRSELLQPTSMVLGDSVFDDGYDQVADGAVFAVSGGDRRIEVHFEKGFPAAQIYAPSDDDVVCFEPMTASTDSLSRGDYRLAQPGQTAVAVFSIRV